MASKATTLGELIADLMKKHQHSNRSLAAAAGVSESAVRNLLKVGVEAESKDPDARTLTLVAKALDVDSLRLFRLAGYIPPEPTAHSLRAEYLANLFDRLPNEKQDAVLGVLEAMLDNAEDRQAVEAMRADADNPLAGMDLVTPGINRTLANALMAQLQMTHPNEADQIPPDTKIINYTWAELPQATRERIKALIRHKLSLDYDPTMVDPEWRD